MPFLNGVPVDFLYTQTDDFGEGTFTVTVGTPPPLNVAATATPSSIAPGGSSQLDVTVTGGVPPYTYGWTNGATLNSATISNPVAMPVGTTTYTVTVTDSTNTQSTASVTVDVQQVLTVTASPQTINAGQFTQLNATLAGAVPPVFYQWTPTFAVSNPNIANPLGAPSTTTTFMVTVIDANGTYNGSVTVNVNMNAFASASPTVINAGQTSQLNVVASGGTPPYSYAWAPSASLSDPSIANPVASPSATTTYTVTVTDALGASLQRTVTVDVNAPGGGGLSACYSVNPSPPLAGQFFTIDMTCSTGNIQEYRVYFAGNLFYAGSQPTYTTMFEGAFTTTIRVEVVESGTGTVDFVEDPFTTQ